MSKTTADMLLIIVGTALVCRLTSSQNTLNVANGTGAVSRPTTVDAEGTAEPGKGYGSEGQLNELHLDC